MGAILPKNRTQADVIRIPLNFAGNKVKVLSYNVENFFDNSNDPNSRVDDIRWAKSVKSIKALAEVIKAQNPDVMAFQEVENREVLENLNKNYLGNQYPNIVIFPTNDARGIRVAIMSKNSIKMTNPTSHRDEKLPNNEPCFKRDFIEATFETDTGFKFTLFTTHFKSMRGGEEQTTPVRLNEARRGKKIMNERIQQDANVKLLLMGDLNTLHNQHGQKVLDALNGKDETDPKFKMTELLEKDGKVPATHDGGQNFPDSKLDYAYASPALLKLAKAEVVGKMRTKPYSEASDHLPVLVTIEEPDANANTVKFAGAHRQNVAPLRAEKRLQVMA